MKWSFRWYTNIRVYENYTMPQIIIYYFHSFVIHHWTPNYYLLFALLSPSCLIEMYVHTLLSPSCLIEMYVHTLLSPSCLIEMYVHTLFSPSCLIEMYVHTLRIQFVDWCKTTCKVRAHATSSHCVACDVTRLFSSPLLPPSRTHNPPSPWCDWMGQR